MIYLTKEDTRKTAQISADHRTVENTCNGEVYTSFPVEAINSTQYKLHIPSDHVEANQIVQHSKRPMGIPFVTPRNNRILNWTSPVGVAQ